MAPEKADDHLKYYKHIRKIYKYLARMDRIKDQAPRFSESMEGLCKFIRETQGETSETASTLTSTFSVFQVNTAAMNSSGPVETGQFNLAACHQSSAGPRAGGGTENDLEEILEDSRTTKPTKAKAKNV